MSRTVCRLVPSCAGFPRVSGDEPAKPVTCFLGVPFSPRERG